MKKTSKVIAVTVSVLISAKLYAGEWSGGTNIEQIYPHSINNVDGTIYYRFGIMKNPSSCQNSGYIALKKSNKLSSEIYSLMLTAFTVKKMVNYYANGCDSHGYPVLEHAIFSN